MCNCEFHPIPLQNWCFHNAVTVVETTGILNYIGSHLGRIVKKCTVKSLFDYGITFTMKYAARELMQTNKIAADIAAELYFSYRSHFYRLLKDHFEVTPNEYRKLNCL